MLQLQWLWIVLAAFIVFIIALYLISPLVAPKPAQIKGSHILVTGGSSGIGKSISIQAVQAGGKVTLLARNKAKLEEARTEIMSLAGITKKDKRVHIVSVDLSGNFAAISSAMKDVESLMGPVDILINCAGTALPGCFDEVPLDDFKKMMDINFMSAVHATRALVPGMKSRRKGRVVFISSQAGQLGIYGYTAYSASKFALRGFAESLQMELKPFNIYVTLAFPPDTDTPGYEKENEAKPEETRLISESSSLFHPEAVAKIILEDATRGRFFSSIGIDGVMLSCVTCGFSPVTSIMDATQQVMSMGFFRIIAIFYLQHFNRLIRKCKEGKAAKKIQNGRKESK